MDSPRVAVIGAGWSGATCARVLSDAGVRVEVFEKDSASGGHSRVETLGGVVFEPNGAHIFHTSDPEVRRLVERFGMRRPYAHRVLAEVFLDEDDDEPVLVSWPLQLAELRALRIWPEVERELAELPPRPQGENLAAYVTSLMGPTLYRLFVDGYTRKQWGIEPSELSAEFATKRVPLRDDGDTRMFRDTWEFYPPTGVNSIIERMLFSAALTCDAQLGIADLDTLGREFDAVVITGALDEFVGGSTTLDWRGVRMESRLTPTEGLRDTVTPAYVVNHPLPRVPYTRTVESKHATGQRIRATVVSEEYPGANARHYPVATADGRHRHTLNRLMDDIRAAARTPVFFVGRLAEYVYIDQDEAVRRAMDRSTEILELLHG